VKLFGHDEFKIWISELDAENVISAILSKCGSEGERNMYEWVSRGWMDREWMGVLRESRAKTPTKKFVGDLLRRMGLKANQVDQLRPNAKEHNGDSLTSCDLWDTVEKLMAAHFEENPDEVSESDSVTFL
jgi:hypothetical protein